mgnify:FL=1
MLIPHDPDRYVTEAKHTTCAYHQAHPGKPWAGCTCGGSMGLREATPEEYRARRARRLAERRKELRSELDAIEAENRDAGALTEEAK